MHELHYVNFMVIFLTTLSQNISPNQIAFKRVNSFFQRPTTFFVHCLQMAGLVRASERSNNNYHGVVMWHWIGTHMSVKALFTVM